MEGLPQAGEIRAILKALEKAKELGITECVIISDSYYGYKGKT